MNKSKANDPTFEKKNNPLRVISKKQLLDMIPYSDSHIARLEKRGQFPKRIRFGAQRVGWLLSEIESWIEQKRSSSSDSQSDPGNKKRRK